MKIHAAPITKHGEIDYEAVVKLSDGFNGADLRNVCTEAGWSIFRACNLSQFFSVSLPPSQNLSHIMTM